RRLEPLGSRGRPSAQRQREQERDRGKRDRMDRSWRHEASRAGPSNASPAHPSYLARVARLPRFNVGTWNGCEARRRQRTAASRNSTADAENDAHCLADLNSSRMRRNSGWVSPSFSSLSKSSRIVCSQVLSPTVSPTYFK